jgi:hypothetical protein
MKAKLFEVVVHTKIKGEEGEVSIPEMLFDDKIWAADEMAAGMKAMEEINSGKPEAERISPDKVVVLIRPF